MIIWYFMNLFTKLHNLILRVHLCSICDCVCVDCVLFYWSMALFMDQPSDKNAWIVICSNKKIFFYSIFNNKFSVFNKISGVRLDTAYFAENNKKIIKKLLFILRLLFISLNAMFMSHEQCNGRWFRKKKKKHKRRGRDAQNKHSLSLYKFFFYFFIFLFFYFRYI